METVGSYEAKTHLSALLERVAKGEKIRITKHGMPIALLVPVDAQNEMTPEEAVDAMLEFGKGRKLDGLSIRDMIEEGRRF